MPRKKATSSTTQQVAPDNDKSGLSDELISQFLLAELGSLTQRAIQHENVMNNKLNFFFALVTAISGGLLLASSNQNLSAVIVPVTSLLSLLLHLTGWLTISQTLDLRYGSLTMYRRMGRIRAWFHEREKKLLPYMAFPPTDGQPNFYFPNAPLRGIDALLIAFNSLTLAVSISMLWFFISFQVLKLNYSQVGYPYLFGLSIGILCIIILWFIQVRYYHREFRRLERKFLEQGRIHFPFTPDISESQLTSKE